MEKKYHPIVTFKSLIEEFLHRYSIYAAKEQSHHFELFADCTRQDHHWHPPSKRIRARVERCKSAQLIRTAF